MITICNTVNNTAVSCTKYKSKLRTNKDQIMVPAHFHDVTDDKIW